MKKTSRAFDGSRAGNLLRHGKVLKRDTLMCRAERPEAKLSSDRA